MLELSSILISLKFLDISIFFIFSLIMIHWKFLLFKSLSNFFKELLRATRYLNSFLISILVIISFPIV